MIVKSILKSELFHPSSKSEFEIPRGLSMGNSLLLSTALGAYLNNYYQLRVPILFIILCAVLFAGLILLIDLNKKNLLCYFTMIGVVITGTIIGKLFKFSYIQWLKNIYKWCFTYNGEDMSFNRGYSLAVMTGILLLSCIITYVLHRYKKVKNYIAAILPCLLIILSLYSISIPKITVGVVIFYSLTILVEIYGKMFYKSKNKVNNSIATVYLAPACALIAIMAICLPSNPEPIQWKGIKDVIHKVQEQSVIWRMELGYFFNQTGSEFAVSFSGYSEDAVDELGGEVNRNDKTSLLVTAKKQSTSKGYLIGSISDTYTGRMWEKTQLEHHYIREDYYLDFYELLTAFTIEEEKGIDISNMIQKRYYTIEYYDIKTRTLFYPLKTYKMNLTKSTGLDETAQGAFLYKKAKGVGTKYEVAYYELNLNNEILQRMLRESGSSDFIVSEEALREVAMRIFDYNTFGFNIDIEELTQALIQREKQIKEDYAKLPANLPERVKQLAVALTENYDNKYDKLKAIETYLNTMTYTTNIGKTPKGEDFVDYFLFEQKQGYCTYFATAMGILARCVGIPTRYVEGFVVDYEVKENAETYQVLSSNAHSWIDAYIDGIGWIPFEATPAFYTGRYATWKDIKPVGEYHDTGVAINESQIPANYQDMMNGVKEEYLVSQEVTEKNHYILPIISILFCFLVLFVAVILVYYWLLVRRYNKKFKAASNHNKLMLTLAQVLRYLDKDGFHLMPQETLLNHAQRIGNRIEFNNISFLNIANIFMGVRYGEKVIEEEELKVVMDFSEALEGNLKEKLGKKQMFFDRFVYLHFYQ